MQTQYDVIIPGGGLAGLTLAIQLKRAKPDISILILESRATEATTAAHKVGESTVELATHYMREVLDLKGSAIRARPVTSPFRLASRAGRNGRSPGERPLRCGGLCG